jgi:hypothetical protein
MSGFGAAGTGAAALAAAGAAGALGATTAGEVEAAGVSAGASAPVALAFAAWLRFNRCSGISVTPRTIDA